MTQTIIRGAEFELSATRAPGAPDGLYGAACMTCEAASDWADSDPKRVGMWALLHAQRHGLEHHHFRVTSQRHWRVDRVRHQPATTPPPPPPHQGRPRAHHARPRRRQRNPLVTCALTVSGLLLGVLLVVGG